MGKTAGIICISHLPCNLAPWHNGVMERENNIPEGLDNTQNEVENTVVTPKTIDVFSDFAVTLMEIHVRLIAEGYIVKDGVLIKSERLLSYEQDNKPPRKNR